MNRLVTALAAVAAMTLFGRDTNRYDNAYTDSNGVTWTQRGGMTPSNYVATAFNASNLFATAALDDGSPECEAARAFVRTYVEQVSQDFRATKLTDQDAFFDNLRTNLNAAYSAAMSSMVSTVITNRVTDGYLADSASLSGKRDRADNVCAADSFSPWDFAGAGLTDASLSLEQRDGSWTYYIEATVIGGSGISDYVNEYGTKDEMENVRSVSVTEGSPSVTYTVTRLKVAHSNDVFATYAGVTNAVGSVAAFRNGDAADGVITNCVDDMTQAQKTELLKRLVEYVKKLEGRN